MAKINRIDSVQTLTQRMQEVRAAQKAFAQFSQEQTDRIFRAAASAACKQRIPLARLAVEETGMGVLEDKVVKNHYAAEYIYHAYRDTKTCGVIEHDAAYGIAKIAEPVGVIAAIIPTTNPTSTAIFKALIALKTRNGILLSPHPRAKRCTIAAAKTVLDAAVAAGAPENIIAWIDAPSMELTQAAMQAADVILATGGAGLVRAAYSSGKPAIGVGAGNTPAVITEHADITQAVSAILHSKTFDNGIICASEQAVITVASVYEAVKEEFSARGGYFLCGEEIDRVRNTIFRDGKLHADWVGKTAAEIAQGAGVEVPESTRLLLAEVAQLGREDLLAHEKLCPMLAVYKAVDFADAVEQAARLVQDGGHGHTAVIHADVQTEQTEIDQFSARVEACRILVNTPAAQGGIGDLYNFRLAPSLTLGCGSWGGNSVSENVGVSHLLNIKTVAHKRENMLWFRTPPKIYFKRGCLPEALRELRDPLGKQRVFVVTDRYLYQHGYTDRITKQLGDMGIQYTVFSDVTPDPTLGCAQAGAMAMASFTPDCVLALGGGSAMDAAKAMWILYDQPDVDFHDLAMRFMDIRKRIAPFPVSDRRAYFIAVPTTAGTGSEVTPFAVITDETTGTKHPLADYALLPDMAIIDPDLMTDAPPSLTAASGIDALTHAIEAYAAMPASAFTDALALGAVKTLFACLPRVYANGADLPAREQTAYAATMAGMAFANAFLGLCHSMAHKLGSYHHLPHGIANALLITEVMRFNAAHAPIKMGSFPQYSHPHTLERYAQLADAIGIQGESNSDKLQGLIQKIESLKATLGIQASIRAYGIAEGAFFATLDQMTEAAFDDQCTGANPRYPLLAEIREIYLRAYYGEKS